MSDTKVYKTFFIPEAPIIIRRVRYISVAHGPVIPKSLRMHVKNYSINGSENVKVTFYLEKVRIFSFFNAN